VCFIFVYPIQYKSYRTTLTNRSDSLQIDPNHYKSIRTTSYQSDSLQIDPIHYKSIRTDPNHYKNYKSIRFYESIRLTTNLTDSTQIDPMHYKSIRFTIYSYSYRFQHTYGIVLREGAARTDSDLIVGYYLSLVKKSSTMANGRTECCSSSRVQYLVASSRPLEYIIDRSTIQR
jgi:hypothetical protein